MSDPAAPEAGVDPGADATPLRVPVRAGGPAVLAFDVGGTTIKAALVDEHGSVVATRTVESGQGPAVLTNVVEAADALRASSAVVPQRVGVIVPGLVDASRGVAVRAVNLGLVDAPVAAPLSARLQLPVSLGHDVTVAAHLIAKDSLGSDPFVVVIGTGIAAVSFIDGVAVRGRSGQAGEFGHVSVDRDGPLCACGARGCIETIASAAAIERAYTARTGRIAGAHEIAGRRTGDAAASAVWADAVDALARGLVAVNALLAPGSVILGGGLAEAGAALTQPIERRMAELGSVLPLPKVRSTPLGQRAGMLGAALLARGEL